LDVASNNATVSQTIRSTSSGETNVSLRIQDGTTGTGSSDGLYLGRAGAVNYLWTYENEPWVFATNNAERARITSGGELLVGGTSAVLSSKFLSQFDGNSHNGAILNETASAASATFLAFALSGTAIGSVVRVGATSAVIYNTTSDYRLKTVVGPVADAGQRIDALQPVEYTWNADGTRTRGFLAHQFQEVYASSVSGTKDAVDAEGKPVYQSMQASTSEVIADLVAELQSLRARVAALESI
jgi:hypothetical protein